VFYSKALVIVEGDREFVDPLVALAVRLWLGDFLIAEIVVPRFCLCTDLSNNHVRFFGTGCLC